FSYDWSREVDTSSSVYYRWTQWLFLQLYKKGLAYKKKAPVNWCPSCQTVLANEQVVDGACERCHTSVEQKELEQWFFKITDYVERLLNDLEGLDWPERIKDMQRNWIGKSQGVDIYSRVKDLDIEFTAYDSVPQTFMAQTFTVIAPEHPMVAKLVEGTTYEKSVMAWIEKIKKKKAAEKFSLEKDVDGIFTGRYVDNPFGTGDLPIWIASFAVMGYGSGIVHCSAHDARDFAFAKKYDIPLRPVMFPKDPSVAEKVRNLDVCFYKDPDGILEQPEELKGMRWGDARESVIAHLEKKGFAKRATHYKIRDWLVSRQRYWGAPIPIVYCDACGMVPVPEKDLPVELPTDVDFQPTGESPLARSKSFHNVVCPKCGAKARRESDTMDTFVDSSWYFLRYCDPKNEKEFVDKKKVAYWSPVDLYVGGAEHAVLHLLYARFITKVLADFGHINFQEPFLKLRNQGMILGEDGQKMSKSRGNVINPDEVVEQYGADTMRLYEMFMGPFEDTKPWSTDGIKGVRRLLEKVDRIFEALPLLKGEGGGEVVNRLLHKTIKKVTEDIESFKFNTAISAMMIFVNEFQNTHASLREAEQSGATKQSLQTFLKLLAPFAPHLAEELWEKLGNTESIFKNSWPIFDPKLVQDEELELVVQVNGKLRDRFAVSASLAEDELKQQALAREKVKTWLQGKKIERVIVVKGRLISIVVS
ncbi:MAG: leucine--tRNA ligase, partial [bacterium]|nr:leucine--tRNA ligase [bacterium]